MKKLYLLSAGLLVCCLAKAQLQPATILKKVVDKIHLLKSVSYTIDGVEKNPFSDGDTTIRKTKETIVFDSSGTIAMMNEEASVNKGKPEVRGLFLNDTLYTITLEDSIYSLNHVTDKKSISYYLGKVTDIINDFVKNPSKIIQRKDTTISGVPCYNFFIALSDTIENNKHCYNYKYVAINKKTLMPLYSKENMAGVATKEGFVIGYINIFNENSFSDFQIDKKINNSIFHFEKSRFDLKNEKMLAVGTMAPQLELKDLSNRQTPVDNFKNKILLVEFGSTGCSANPLANPMLNRFNKKYAGKDLAIISIYTTETNEQVKKYKTSNQLEFPIYIGSKKTKKDFKTIGTPNFYLIDKSGKIIKSIDGYSDDLETTLIKEIDKIIL